MDECKKKGRGRTAAWGALGAVILYVGTFGFAQARTEEGSPSPRPEEAAEAGVYRNDSAAGYVPTYFDGAGGIAGVPLTDEQRRAVMAEADRRGASEQEARLLAYGESDPPTRLVYPIHPPRPQPKVPKLLHRDDATSKVTYREMAPGEDALSHGNSAGSDSGESNERGGHRPAAEDHSSGSTLSALIDAVLPDLFVETEPPATTRRSFPDPNAVMRASKDSGQAGIGSSAPAGLTAAPPDAVPVEGGAPGGVQEAEAGAAAHGGVTSAHGPA